MATSSAARSHAALAPGRVEANSIFMLTKRKRGPAPGVAAGPREATRCRLERHPRHQLQRARPRDAADAAEAVVADDVAVRVVGEVRDGAIGQAGEAHAAVDAGELRV